ncbi:hypothetical protein RUMOBE_02315 [Blautia obeum ATCC 29174]|uniref:Uncharacterized protein n=1 Tax=Blautia obeum ATCC 29174 TaxID=411459 RepID=A5ZTI6_9FIRM|nr:hypothetical protein RUMOBE_02315 [Blautia obeum ATCC 29174]
MRHASMEERKLCSCLAALKDSDMIRFCFILCGMPLLLF